MKNCKARNGVSVNLAPERRGVRCERPAGLSGFCSWHTPERLDAQRRRMVERHAKRRVLREEAALAMENEATLRDMRQEWTHALFFRWAATALRKWRGSLTIPES